MNRLRREMAFGGIRHLAPVNPDRAPAVVRETYAASEKEFVLAPPVTLHATLPELLAAIYQVVRATLIGGAGERADREIVATGVSLSNECPYCEAAHTSMALAADDRGGLKRVLSGDETAGDARGALLEWARATGRAEDYAAVAWPFAAGDSETAATMRATAVAFHYINRVVNVFCDESPMPVKPPGFLRGIFTGMMTMMMRGPVRVRVEPARFNAGAKQAPGDLPAEYDWARQVSAIAGPLAAFEATMNDLGERYIAADVRELLAAQLRDWRGESRGLSRGWVESAIQHLGQDDRPAARLVLLAAMASYQIDDGLIADFRGGQSRDDAALLATIAYGAARAARRIASWL